MAVDQVDQKYEPHEPQYGFGPAMVMVFVLLVDLAQVVIVSLAHSGGWAALSMGGAYLVFMPLWIANAVIGLTIALMALCGAIPHRFAVFAIGISAIATPIYLGWKIGLWLR